MRLAKYGWVRIAAACRQQAKLRRLLRRGHVTLQHITVTRHSDGRWYAPANFTREARVPAAQHTAPAGPVVGVDRGVKTAAVVAASSGQVIAELPNLAAWGEHTLGICPCVTQVGDRHPAGPSAERARHACGGWVSAAASQAAAVLPGEAGTSRPRVSVA